MLVKFMTVAWPLNVVVTVVDILEGNPRLRPRSVDARSPRIGNTAAIQAGSLRLMNIWFSDSFSLVFMVGFVMFPGDRGVATLAVCQTVCIWGLVGIHSCSFGWQDRKSTRLNSSHVS